MPVISSFYGIQISMRFRQSEHNPPHFHAKYGSEEVCIDIKKLKIISGHFSKTAFGLVQTWAKQHQKELLKIWKSQEFSKIEPLV